MNTAVIIAAKYLYLLPVILTLIVVLRTNRQKRWRMLHFAYVYFPLTYTLGAVAKGIYFDPRPFVSGAMPLIEHAADNGFPSDHVLLVGALASLVSVYYRRTGAILWLLAIAVALGRVLAGVHHTIDVVASIIISAGTAWVVYYLHKKHDAAIRSSDE